jgi:hypothetical protein
VSDTTTLKTNQCSWPEGLTPRLPVVIEAALVVSLAVRDNARGAALVHDGVHVAADVAEVLVLPVAQRENSELGLFKFVVFPLHTRKPTRYKKQGA